MQSLPQEVRDFIEEYDGVQKWFIDGLLHSDDDKPAVIRKGVQEWYYKGMRHRIGGPAIVRSDGSEEWYENDERHRLDGPAILRANGSKEWYVYGIHCSKNNELYSTYGKKL